MILSDIQNEYGYIPRMFDEFSRYGLAEPELVDMDGDFRVNFYRSSVTPKVTERECSDRYGTWIIK